MGSRLGLSGAALAIAGAAVAAVASPTPAVLLGAALVLVGVTVAAMMLATPAPPAPAPPPRPDPSVGFLEEELGRSRAALHQAEVKMAALVEARVRIVATERDLDQARRMYRQILPLQASAEHDGLTLAGSCSPANETGGDWWTYRKLSGGRMLLVIGDATGHGVHSAMVGCMAHGAIRALAALGEEHLTPRRALDAVNNAIKVPGADVASMTLLSCLVDPVAGHLQYVNHGHVFPLIATRGDDGRLGEVASVTGVRDPDDLGIDGDSLEVRHGTCPLPAGAVLVCFTDGLVERAGTNHRPFGGRRLRQALLTAAPPDGAAGLIALRDHVLRAVDAYVGGAPLEDDLTLVLVGLPAAVRR